MKEIKLTRKPGMPVFNEIKGGKEINEERKKHEEIKRMAFEFFRDIQMVLARNRQATIENIPVLLKGAWVRAEAFYKFAKEKEGNE